MVLAIATFTFLSVTYGVVIGYRYWHEYNSVNSRLANYGMSLENNPDAKTITQEKNSILRSLLEKLALLIAKRTSQHNNSKLRRQLILAGNPGNLQPSEFIALKVIICGLVAIIGIIVRVSLLNLVLIVAIGWLIPNIYLQQAIKKRQLAISLSMSNVLDLLTVSVEAGLGFDAAVAKVVEKMDGPLAEEFQRMLYEIQIGRPRKQALCNLKERTGVGYLKSFTAAVIQADQLGIGISRVLRIQANEIRRQRRQKAEAEAMKAPVKMLIPLVLLVFPALLIVLLGPAVLSLLATL